MSFKEVLESIGLTAEQIAQVEAGMKEAGIYTAAQEGLDQKYADLRKEYEKFKDINPDDGSKDTRIKELEKENSDLKYKNAENKVMADYHVNNPEYISYLISQKGASLKEDGTIEGIDSIMEEIKKAQPEFFGSQTRTERRRVEVKEWNKSSALEKEPEASSLKEAIAEKIRVGGNEE